MIIWPLLNKSNKRSCVTPTHPGNINKKEGEEGGNCPEEPTERQRDRSPLYAEWPKSCPDFEEEDIALWKAKKYSCSWFSFSSVRNHNPETVLLGRLQSYLSPVESSTFPGVGINSEMQICKIDVELSLCRQPILFWFSCKRVDAYRGSDTRVVNVPGCDDAHCIMSCSHVSFAFRHFA